jgi:LmbE family N-acetylglucosaminyl deacetylase
MDPEGSCRWIGEGPVLYLAPHSDDAAFSSTGVLHACARRRIPIHIVTCFSISAHCRDGLGQDPAVVSPARKQEDRRFAATLPAPAELRWLDLEDAPLRPQHLGKHPFKETTMTDADTALGALIESRLAPHLDPTTLLLAPLGLGRHIDHLIVRDVAAAIAQSGRARVAFWEDLPYAGRVGLEDLQRDIDASMATMGLELRPHLVIDEHLEECKKSALACYPSQVADVHRNGIFTQMRRVAGNGLLAERLWSTPDPVD